MTDPNLMQSQYDIHQICETQTNEININGDSNSHRFKIQEISKLKFPNPNLPVADSLGGMDSMNDTSGKTVSSTAMVNNIYGKKNFFPYNCQNNDNENRSETANVFEPSVANVKNIPNNLVTTKPLAIKTPTNNSISLKNKSASVVDIVNKTIIDKPDDKKTEPSIPNNVSNILINDDRTIKMTFNPIPKATENKSIPKDMTNIKNKESKLKLTIVKLNIIYDDVKSSLDKYETNIHLNKSIQELFTKWKKEMNSQVKSFESMCEKVKNLELLIVKNIDIV
jgi:hypothetical protein